MGDVEPSGFEQALDEDHVLQLRCRRERLVKSCERRVMRDRKRGAEVNLVKTLAKQQETHTDFMQLSLSCQNRPFTPALTKSDCMSPPPALS